MNLVALKIFLLSRLFLGSTTTIILLVLAIAFNWFDAYELVKSGLTTALAWIDVLRDWGEQVAYTADKVQQAVDKAQQELK
jgi:hypothetical protein